MEREQEEIQFLGFFGVFRESIQIISSWRKIFSQIALVLILPLAFIYLAHIQITDYLFSNILRDEYILDWTPRGSPSYDRISAALSSEWTRLFLFKIGYFIFVLVLGLLSTSAVVYTIACIYTAKEITFRKVIGVVPNVWKRLIVTFLWSFIIVFAYNMVAGLILILWLVVMNVTGLGALGQVVLVALFVIYFVGFIYISVVWHLASVVSVLEDVYGLQAMVKSQSLIKGKMVISVTYFFLLGFLLFCNQMLFEWFLVRYQWRGLGYKIGTAILCLMLQSTITLFGLIIQTIIYFVCKSYHHENIDKSSLSEHLEEYLGEYVPLKSKDVQLERVRV